MKSLPSAGRSVQGFTVLELIATVGLFSLLLVVTAVLFSSTVNHYRSSDASDTAQREMRKVRAAVQQDLALSSPSQMARGRVPASLTGDDGEALWFLSPIDPVTGEAVHRQDGTPFWQRTVLYYLAVPNNHANISDGVACGGFVGPNGFESGCPHKVLVRKIIDTGTPTNATDEGSIEQLPANVTGFLTRPNGYDVSGISEPGVEEVKLIATHLLHFESRTGGTPEELAFDLRAVSIGAARKEISLGNQDLTTSRFTLQAPFFVQLHN